VDRTALLTPSAPDGATTDAYQIRDMVTNVSDPDPVPTDPDKPVTLGADDGALTWNWGVQTSYLNFDPGQDTINFNSFAGDKLAVSEVNGDLLIEVLGQNGNITVLQNIQAEDLRQANLTTAGWNTILDQYSALMQESLDSLDLSPSRVNCIKEASVFWQNRLTWSCK
jgi:hypothetical protein